MDIGKELRVIEVDEIPAETGEVEPIVAERPAEEPVDSQPESP